MHTIKVLQYNTFLRRELPYIANLYDGQQARMHNMARKLQRKGSSIDILVLSEVFHGNRKQLLSQLQDTWPYHTRELSKTVSLETSGLFILSKTKILEEDGIVFKNSKHWDALASKGVKYIHTVHNNVHVHVFSTHLQATYNNDLGTFGAIRKRQILEMRQFIQSKQINKKDLVIISGDFNIEYRSSEYRSLTKQLGALPFNHITAKKSVSTKNQWHGISHEANQNGCLEEYKKTHVCSCCPEEMIDFIFVLKGYLKPKSTNLDVWTNFKPTERICGLFYNRLSKKSGDQCPVNEVELRELSDHFPVVCVISLPNKKNSLRSNK
jgi:endonuclease/exonuclease/phosphatase family metal-dependent hydrolase